MLQFVCYPLLLANSLALDADVPNLKPPRPYLTAFIIGGVVLLRFICYSMLSVKMQPGANTILLNYQDTVSSVLPVTWYLWKVSEHKLHFIVNPEWCWWVLQCASRFYNRHWHNSSCSRGIQTFVHLQT